MLVSFVKLCENETKLKSLVQDNSAGDVGAILAQGPTHLLRSCCFACSFCCSIALGARAAMFPNQSVAMRFNTVAMRFNTVTEVRMHYQLPDDVWNAFTEVCGNPRDDLKLMAILPPRIVAASPSKSCSTRWPISLSNSGIPCGVGLQFAPTNCAHQWGEQTGTHGRRRRRLETQLHEETKVFKQVPLLLPQHRWNESSR